MSSTIQIVGFSSAWKVPGYYAETVYGAGAISQGSIQLKLLLLGNKISAGSAVADQDIVAIGSVTDADTLLGAGSELAIMCYAALLEPGVQILAAPVAEGGGAAAGTATITITGTSATAAGTFGYRVDGKLVTGGIALGDAPTAIGDSIVAAVMGNPRLPVTAVNTTGVVVLTRKNKGPRGNQGALFQITGVPAAGIVSAITGGAAMTGGGVHFTGGATADSLTNVLAIEFPGQYDRIAAAHNDATNAGLLATQIATKAGVLEGRMEHAVIASGSSLGSTTTIATGLNAQRVQVLWYLNSESHPSEISARFAARRTAVEQGDPDAAYDGFVLNGIVANQQPADNPSTTTQQSALNNGVTPIKTVNGQPTLVRSITSHSLNGSLPDYRTLDTSDAYVPDYVRVGLGFVWLTEFVVANPRVQDNPPAGAKEPPAGIATPDRWSQRATKYLREQEQASPPILINVDANPVSSGYDTTGKRIMSAVPVVPAPNQHSIGVSVRSFS